MSHPSPAATAEPACLGNTPQHTGKHRGNRDLGLAPRCGARTRAGCPCRAPAIRGKLRCRMHGGRSTGLRTPAGMARLRAARTVHGAYSAETRARNRYALVLLRRAQVGNAAADCLDRLPPDLAARLLRMPPELLPPPWSPGGLTPAEDRAVLRAEAEALAPSRAAIAQAALTGRAANGGAPSSAPGRTAPGHAVRRRRSSSPRFRQNSMYQGALPSRPTPARQNPMYHFRLPPPPPWRLCPPRSRTAAPTPSRPGARRRTPSQNPMYQIAPPPRTTPARQNPLNHFRPPAPPPRRPGPPRTHAPAHTPRRPNARTLEPPARTPCTRGRARPAPNRGARTLCTSPRRRARIPPGLPNRAAHRRWRSLQRRLHRAPAACSHP